ncbi:PACE efflux transporter [Terasakiella pusilla]|uniref:PACE efflux transporter n=1 Tax=Terasakiella pusilla TaxID=64973 RepID=UPI00048E9020|nr:PACE efflux transporter [Terasakiella pusilla]
MRTLSDRIRHTMMFEIMAILLTTFLGGWITGLEMAEIGMLGVFFSLIAMTWNLIFNYLFDLWNNKYRDAQAKTVILRVIHASIFEGVLFVIGIFLTMWWLEVGLWYAIILDAGLSLFFLVYAFLFNWGYDIVFPIPQSTQEEVPAQ